MPREPNAVPIRRICFVTGTRAEFGLMRSTLKAISAHPALELQLIVTGMHLDPSRGRSIDGIRKEGWEIDAVIPWNKSDGSPSASAVATGKAMSGIATEILTLRTDVVLVVGDRVEAFAAASAAHLSGKLVAHIHGGDRALGLVDDSLRHAISKLSHVHFPATPLSAARLARMGEDSWRIIRAGSPGLDGIRDTAAGRRALAQDFPQLIKRQFALLVLHPQSPLSDEQHALAQLVIQCVKAINFPHIVVVYPNNDPGSEGIVSCWKNFPAEGRLIFRPDFSRPLFLGLLRDAAVLVGNSSSGIIEAASFGTPVVNIGIRQQGREHGENVTHAPAKERAIKRELMRIWSDGNPIRYSARNIYGSGRACHKIASTLSRIDMQQFRSKLIAY